MKCRQCGESIPENAAFCPQCGAAIHLSNAKVQPPPIPPSYLAAAASPDIIKRPPVISALAIFNYICAAGYLLCAIALLFAFLKEQRPALAISLGALITSVAIAHFICGRGLWSLQKLGRTIQIVFAAVWIIAFPIGTVLSILIFVYLLKPEIKILFSGKTAEMLTQPERNMLAKMQASSMNTAAVAGLVIAGFFVVIFVSGIVAAIAIPNLLNAIQRGKQKRTMVDIRTMATAIERYATDHNAYPPASSVGELRKYLEPQYAPRIPEMDGWMHPYRYIAWGHGTERITEYMIVSGGKDGEFEHEDFEAYEKAGTTNFNNDIVFSNGEFLQYPEMAITSAVD